MNRLLDYFKDFFPISDEIENKLKAIIIEKELVKGELILEDISSENPKKQTGQRLNSEERNR